MVFMTIHAAGQASVLTQHNDIGRTGQNTQETILNTTNVNVNQFGLLFNLPVQGQVYAQPLYVPKVTINGGVHNVLIVATEDENVYAFDADNPAAPLWTVSLVDAAHGAGPGEGPMQALTSIGCGDLQPNIGITSTPVIDPVAGTIYVEAKSTNGSAYFHRLHALNLATGGEKLPGPALITASVPGTGDASENGTLTFDPYYHNSRPGLLLMNGSVYVGFASHCDFSPFHGWLFAYNASSLAKQSVFVTTPNGGLGGFWNSDAGFAADGSYIYASSGNGSFDTNNVPATELGDTIMKLGTTSGNLSLQDYFTPSDQSCLASEDKDLGSGGVLLLPNQTGTYPHILVAAGKQGAIYVVNRDQMTASNNHFEDSDDCFTQDPQILEETPSYMIGAVFGTPAYWNNSLYFWGAHDSLRSIPLVNGLPDFNQMTANSTVFGFPGATPSISSNGTAAGTGILWAIDSSQYAGPVGKTPGPAVLYAFDATNISNELWASNQAPKNRDTAGIAVKYAVPTVVNGKVYIGTSNAVNVYGIFSGAVLTSPVQGSKLATSNVTFTWTPGSAVTAYLLTLGTAGQGSYNLWESGSLTATSVEATGIPLNGTTLYVTLFSMINGMWKPAYYTYNLEELAALTAPAAESAMSGSNATFSWTKGVGPTAYELWLGTDGPGTNNIYNSGSLITSITSAKVNGIPSDGVEIYATLWSKFNGLWESNGYAYTEAGTPVLAALTAPMPESAMSGSSATFSWVRGAGPTAYELWLGTTGPSSKDIYNSGSLSTSVTSEKVTGLPTDGVWIYATLWSKMNGLWKSNNYTYTEAGTPVLAALTAPAAESKLSGSSVAFSWSNGAGPTAYELWLGTTGPRSKDIYNSGSMSTSITSLRVADLPTDGVWIYATLWSKMNGLWKSNSYTFTEEGKPALAALAAPTPGSVLTGSSATFSWTKGLGPTAYELWLGTTGPSSKNLYNSGSLSTNFISEKVTDVPTDGVWIYATLWSKINGLWKSNNYTYVEAGKPALAGLIDPTPGSVLSGSSVTFSWTKGAGPQPTSFGWERTGPAPGTSITPAR